MKKRLIFLSIFCCLALLLTSCALFQKKPQDEENNGVQHEEPANPQEQDSTDDPANDPTDDPADDPSDDPTDDPTDDPAEDQNDPTENPTDDPAEDPSDPAEVPTDDPADQPTENPSDDPGNDNPGEENSSGGVTISDETTSVNSSEERADYDDLIWEP